MGLASKVIHDSGFSGIRVLIGILRGVVLIPIITNLLGADSYGIWTTALAFVGLVTTSGEMHLHGSLIRFSAGSDDTQTYSDILSLSILLAFFISILTIIIGMLVDLTQLIDGVRLKQQDLVISLGFLILSNIILRININFPRSQGKVRAYEAIRIIRNSTETFILIIIFSFGGTVITGIRALVGVGITLNVVLIFIFIYRFEIPPPKPSNFSKYVGYGIPMIPASISNKLIQNSDKYMILYFISPTAVGVYAVAHSICSSLTSFSSVLNPTLYPSVATAWEKQNINQLRNLYRLIFRYYTIISVPAFLGLSYISFDVITVFSTTMIAREGRILVPILAIGFLLQGYENPLEYILTSTKDTKLIAKSTIITAITNISLNFILIFYYGIAGAAVATAVSYSIGLMLIYYYSTDKLTFDLPTISFFRAIIAAGIMIGVLYLFPFNTPPTISILLLPLLGSLTYFVVLYYLGEFSPEELKRAKSTILRS